MHAWIGVVALEFELDALIRSMLYIYSAKLIINLTINFCEY